VIGSWELGVGSRGAGGRQEAVGRRQKEVGRRQQEIKFNSQSAGVKDGNRRGHGSSGGPQGEVVVATVKRSEGSEEFYYVVYVSGTS